MASSVVRFAQAQGFGSPLGSESGWKQPLAPPTARAGSAQSARQPLTPPTAQATPPPTISTTAARPKPTNVAIPYARTSPTQIDAGEIVLVNTSLAFPRVDWKDLHNDILSRAIDHGMRMRVGVGTNSFDSVRTLEEVNKRLFQVPTEGPRVTSPPAEAEAEAFAEAFSWCPDGVCISSEVDGPEFSDRTHPIVNVAVYGPTPLINDDERRAFSRSDHRVSRIFVGLAGINDGGDKYFKFVRFSTRDIMMYDKPPENNPEPKPSHNKLGDPKIEDIFFAWRIGRIMDRNLGMKFQNSGLVHVDISPLIWAPGRNPRGSNEGLKVTVDRDGIAGSMHPAFEVEYGKEKDLLESLKDYVGTRI